MRTAWAHSAYYTQISDGPVQDEILGRQIGMARIGLPAVETDQCDDCVLAWESDSVRDNDFDFFKGG